jgi:esterase
MGFVLHHDLIAGEGASAWMLVIHGLFGSGQNWRSFARRVTGQRPEWGIVLVDLREHGRSQGALPPHTLGAAAEDLADLAAVLGFDGKPVRAIAGHSFGGKVALRYRAEAGPDLRATWVFDASPSERPNAMFESEPGGVVWVVEQLESLPQEFEDREAMVRALVERGLEQGVALWLAMNLEPRKGDGRHVLRLDLASIRSLLSDYYAQDLWGAIEDEEAPGDVFVIAAGRSSALDEDDRAYLARLANERPRVHYHEIAEAGHWVHVDALDPLVELVVAGLPGAAH